MRVPKSVDEAYESDGMPSIKNAYANKMITQMIWLVIKRLLGIWFLFEGLRSIKNKKNVRKLFFM